MADAYATFDDVIKRYNPITTMIGSGPTDVTTDDVSSVFISDAQNFIDAFLRARYITPLAVEPMITQLTSDLALYKMAEDRAPRIPEFLDRRYTNCMSLLGMLRDGTMQLSSANLVNSGEGDQEAWSSVLEYGGPVFSPVEARTFSRSWDCI